MERAKLEKEMSDLVGKVERRAKRFTEERKAKAEREREERQWSSQKEDPAMTEMREAMLSQMQAQTQLMTQLAEGGTKQRDKEEEKEKKKKPKPHPDWHAEVDPGTGETYYHNPKTGETAW